MGGDGQRGGDPGEANRGISQAIIGDPSPGPLQRPLDPNAGGPGSGAGAPQSSDDEVAPATEEARAIRDHGLPQNR